MKKYPKIKTVWDRDPDNNYKTLIEGQWAKPEFEYLKDNDWVCTEKIHGTNIRVIWDGDNVEFRGRTDKAQIPPFLLDSLEELFPRQKFILSFPDTPMTLYGEGYGAKIQGGGGKYIPDGTSFILFDVIIDDWWLKLDDTVDIAGKLNISHVPVRHVGTLEEAVEIVRGDMKSVVAEDESHVEGLVMKPKVQLFNRLGERMIKKVKCKDFK